FVFFIHYLFHIFLLFLIYFFIFFFFSSRRRHTRSKRDWSSDVCSSDLFWEGLRSGIAVIETVTLADLEVAWDMGVSWRDQEFSIVDRTSFAVMRRLGIDRVASLDAHFAVFRFGPKRRQSFHVLR